MKRSEKANETPADILSTADVSIHYSIEILKLLITANAKIIYSIDFDV